MWVYWKSEEGFWTVGFRVGSCGLRSVRNFAGEIGAARYVHFLNGGGAPGRVRYDAWGKETIIVE